MVAGAAPPDEHSQLGTGGSARSASRRDTPGASAVYYASGKRVRDLPITLDKLLWSARVHTACDLAPIFWSQAASWVWK